MKENEMTENEMNENTKSSENTENLEKKLRWNISAAIDVVCTTLRNSSLEFGESAKYKNAMTHLTEYFNVSKIQVWILCLAALRYFQNSRSVLEMDSLSDYIECSVMKIVSWTGDIKELVEKNYLKMDSERNDWDERVSGFSLSEEIADAIASNSNFTICAEKKELDYVDFVNQMANIYENRRDNHQSTYRVLRELSQYEKVGKNLNFVKEAKKRIEDKEARFFYYDMCSDFLSGNDTAMERTICDLYDSSARYMVAKQMMEGEHPLFKLGLVEFVRKGNLRDATMTLSEQGKELLLGEDMVLFEKKLDDKLLIKPETIKEKKLYYSEENQKQISRLAAVLSDDKLKAVQSRLKDSGMPVGVAVLLYGAPGTGKTESVYQIARQTGRPIVHVDISDSKSCWFGESEKKIKQVFTNYKRMCDTAVKQSGKMPILMFNEADAIFSKRKDSNSGNVAQTENAIQNIILEEMENLQGILVATTNLADNLDAAFERRFLFKIKFENPSVQAKKSIWLDKLSWLSEEAAENFAKTYELSGGQIDNIVRKITMNEVITGERPELYEIDDMCVQEKLNKSNSSHIGFAC